MLIQLPWYLFLVRAFLLYDDCPNTSQCTCDNIQRDVVCASRDLHVVPVFQHYTTNYKSVSLRNNSIASLNDGAFSVFGCTSEDFSLDLSRNNIFSVSDWGFRGLENCRLHLDLSFNELESLPVAIGNLNFLKTLNVLGNPLLHLDTSILLNLGPRLSDFRVDIRHFPTWPGTALQLLPELETLELAGIPFHQLENTAFNNMIRLNEITISDTQLKAVPQAICYLRNLSTFSMFNNQHLNETDYPMFDLCGLSNRSDIQLNNLFFYGNKMNVFPNFMAMFPKIRKLDVGRNVISSMDEDRLSEAPGLRAISMDRNLFTRIPYALNKFTDLTYLSLSENQISSVEEADFGKLTQLLTLDLDGNPLLYITHNAFVNNKYLNTVYLSRTYLRTVSLALTLLPNLSVLTLNDALVSCDCNMVYLTQWVRSENVYFRNATCFDKPILIEQFVSNYRSFCLTK